MRQSFLALLGLVLLAACATPAPNASPPASPDAVIRLERGPCFGACPSYSVTLTGAGEVTYEGQRFVNVTGSQTARVPPADVARLIARFHAAGFNNLRSEYRARVTDLPTYTLSLTEGGVTKTVVDYGGDMIGMPSIVRELEDAVDETAGTGRWIHAD